MTSTLVAIFLTAGFALPEQNARGIGLAGSGAAVATGASTIFYNPGALGFEEGFAAEVSGLMIVPSFDYAPLRAVDGTAASAQTKVFALPSLFIAVPVGPVRLGLGAFANYGLGIAWPTGWDGRFDATASNLQTFTLNPTVAWRVHEHVSIGAGFDLVRGTVELVRQLDFLDQEGTLRLGGDTWGYSGNVGISTHWLQERLRVGLAWRAAVALRFRGRADFSVPKEFQAQLTDQDVKTSLLLPHTFTLGASHKLGKRLLLTLEATVTTWSTLKAIVIEFAGGVPKATLDRQWQDTVTVRAAGEITVVPKKLLVRLGAGFDPSPSPATTLSPSLPDASRVMISAGLGYVLGNFRADLGYLFVLLLSRESAEPAFPARYSGLAHVIGLSVGFQQ